MATTDQKVGNPFSNVIASVDSNAADSRRPRVISSTGYGVNYNKQYGDGDKESVCFLCCFRTSSDRSDVVKTSPTKRLSEPKSLLPAQVAQDVGKKTLVLDLDETLVHSSFKPVQNPDLVIPVEIEGQVHPVYVLKRPGVDHFMKRMGEKFEIVVFTASLAKYADALLDQFDIHNVVRWRLFREGCILWEGNYVKDLSRMGRRLQSIIIVDNSPASYMFQPQNAVPISTFIDDSTDRELYDLIPLLEAMTNVDDVTKALNADA